MLNLLCLRLAVAGRKSKVRFIVRAIGSKSVVCLWLLCAATLFLFGCGVGPAEQSTGLSSAGEKKLIGTLLYSDGEPVAGSAVTLLSTGEAAMTNSDGDFALNTLALSGDVWIDVEGSWGGARLLLESIPSSASQVQIGATLTEDLTELKLVAIDIKQSAARQTTAAQSIESQITRSKCSTCHTFRSEARCSDQAWISLHQLVLVCPVPQSDTEPIFDFPSEGVDGSTQDPDEDPNLSDSPTSNKPVKDKPSSECTRCHGDRGSARCSSDSWKSLHSWYDCSNNGDDNNGKPKKKKKKKKNEKVLIQARLLVG